MVPSSRSSNGLPSGINMCLVLPRRRGVAPLPIGEALTRSLTLAFATMVVSTVLGTMTAQAFRTNFKGSGFVFYLVVLGMMVPGVLLGLGMSLVANQLGIDRTWWGTAFVLHVVYTFPFAFLVMLAIFNRFDGRVEEASLALGVTPARTFRKITFPIIFRAFFLRCSLLSRCLMMSFRAHYLRVGRM